MKIIIVGPAFPLRGGIAAFDERLARELMKENHQVEIVSFSLQYPNFLFPGKTQLSMEERPNDLKINALINSINPISWIKTARYIKKQNPDKVIFAYWMSFFAPCYHFIAKRLKGIKKTGLVHNLFPHEKSIIDKIFSPCFIKKMDNFAALSKSVLADIQTIDKQDKTKIFSPHPIYDHFGPKEDRTVALRNLHLSEEYHYVLFFGLIRAYKGLDLLLEAFADKRIRDLKLRLLVAGEFYEDESLYLKKIEDLGISDSVIIRNQFIPDGEVKDYFNAADLVAQPYKTATQSGITQIGFHFEKAMLVTDVGGLKEIIAHQEFGYVVEPKSQNIADAIVDFFENDRKSSFEQKVVKEKQKYAWNVLAEKLINL